MSQCTLLLAGKTVRLFIVPRPRRPESTARPRSIAARRLRAVVDAQLGIDTLDVVARRLLGDEQFGGDFTVRPALRDESEDFDLPGGEPRRPGRPPRCPMACRRQDGFHRLGVETSVARLLAQLTGSTARIEGGPLWTWLEKLVISHRRGNRSCAVNSAPASPRGKPDPSIRSSCLVATDTTDSKPSTRLSIRPVR